MLIEADAFRTDGLITVELIGQLPTPCHEVVEAGLFPGSINNLEDPCSAQIFLKEERKPEFENIVCTLGLGNIWTINRVIPDRYSNTVSIYLNGQPVKKIRVTELTVRGMYHIIGL